MSRRRFLIVFLPLALLIAGCSGDRDEGSLRVYLTDVPATALQAVRVTVTTVRVHASASAGENDPGWLDIPVTAVMPVDLMQLRDGILMQLCGATLGEGDYQQVRLVLAPNEASGPPYRNAVVDADGVTSPIGVPTAGTKVSHRFTVAAGMTTDLVLDFDAAASCRLNPDGTYTMDPWITARSTR